MFLLQRNKNAAWGKRATRSSLTVSHLFGSANSGALDYVTASKTKLRRRSIKRDWDSWLATRESCFWSKDRRM